MSRWIDAEWLKIALELYRVVDLSEAPSIDIVRCKECKYFKHGVRFNKPRYTDIENFCAYHMVFGWNANAFCSYGERIDDGDTI